MVLDSSQLYQEALFRATLFLMLCKRLLLDAHAMLGENVSSQKTWGTLIPGKKKQSNKILNGFAAL